MHLIRLLASNLHLRMKIRLRFWGLWALAFSDWIIGRDYREYVHRLNELENEYRRLRRELDEP